MDPQFHYGRVNDFHEMLADGIIHAVGIVLAIGGAAVLIHYATVWAGRPEQIAAWIYGCGLVIALTISLIYNSLPPGRLKWIMRRLDHSAIFILIAATYTPFLQRGADDPIILSLLVAIWVMAVLGITVKCIFPGRYDRLAIALYLLMGWSGLIAFRPIAGLMPPVSMLLIVVGGIIYTVGVIFHVWERLRFHRAIWHAFVVTAAAVHYSAVLTSFRLTDF